MRKFALALLLLLILGIGASLGFYFYALQYYSSPGPLAAETTVLIPKGKGFRQITRSLEETGVLEKTWLYTGIILKTGKAHDFKAGEYRFPAHISPEEVTRQMTEGEVVRHRVTIPEGWASADVIALLEKDETLTGELPQTLPEGSLLPETYEFLRGDTRISLITRMQQSMRETLTRLLPTCAPGLPVSSEDEFVTLASIVEKETGLAAERPKVAAVFINRLRKGMKLQSDPTILYGIYHQTGAWTKNITKKDLETPNEYNTYTIPALPPGPIANPGRASLEAVCHPAETSDLYFVATGDGGHVFAGTLEEHNRNVQRYLGVLRQQKNQ